MKMKTLTVKAVTAVLLGAGLLTGCTMIPDYHRPALPTATQFPTDAKAPAEQGAPQATLIAWKSFYRDASLQQIIGLALENNRDLRISILNIESAQAQYRIQRADLLPTLSAEAGGTVERYPTSVSPTGASEVAHDYSVNGAVASYELDLFGRVRSLSQQALQTYFATEETRKAAQIALISSVATAWFTFQADANLHDLTRQTLVNERAAYQIEQDAYNEGTASLVDLEQAEITVRTAEANLSLYERQMRQDVNELTLLVGAPIPGDLLKRRYMQDIVLNDALSAGVPSDLLMRRPDIAAAEANLKAANANIGAARAAFFPRIALTASGGTASATLHGLFGADSLAWSFAPTISVPIFNYGRNRANLDVAKINKQIEIATYQKAIQTAFREVADALDGRETYKTQQAAQVLLVAASSKAYDLSQERYREGIDGYLDVLVSQRLLYTSQQDLIKLQLLHASNTLSLYGALGGGWNE